MSQWSLEKLLESARSVIAEQHATRLSEEAFEEFARFLDAPVNPKFAALLQEKTRWDA